MSYMDRVAQARQRVGDIRDQGVEEADELQQDFLQRAQAGVDAYKATGQKLATVGGGGFAGTAAVNVAKTTGKELLANYRALTGAGGQAGGGGLGAAPGAAQRATLNAADDDALDAVGDATATAAEGSGALGGLLGASVIPGLQFLAVGAALFSMADGLYHLFHHRKSGHKGAQQSQADPNPVTLTSVGANVTSNFATALPSADGVVDRAAQSTAF